MGGGGGVRPRAAVGFGLGLERLLMVLENTGARTAEPERSDVYLAALGERAAEYVPVLAAELRAAGVKTEFDLMGRALKAQMKYSDMCGARFSEVIGDEEMARGSAALKSMETGESAECAFGAFAEAVKA